MVISTRKIVMRMAGQLDANTSCPRSTTVQLLAFGERSGAVILQISSGELVRLDLGTKEVTMLGKYGGEGKQPVSHLCLHEIGLASLLQELSPSSPTRSSSVQSSSTSPPPRLHSRLRQLPCPALPSKPPGAGSAAVTLLRANRDRPGPPPRPIGPTLILRPAALAAGSAAAVLNLHRDALAPTPPTALHRTYSPPRLTNAVHRRSGRQLASLGHLPKSAGEGNPHPNSESPNALTLGLSAGSTRGKERCCDILEISRNLCNWLVRSSNWPWGIWVCLLCVRNKDRMRLSFPLVAGAVVLKMERFGANLLLTLRSIMSNMWISCESVFKWAAYFTVMVKLILMFSAILFCKCARIGVISGNVIFGPPLQKYWAEKQQQEATKEGKTGST
ncbi:hypothetical protein PR202_gb10758 [Eleusine coracana subsp. coracana]|uniref:DUF7595 domain-containing protein n=1 Tax=Eleusine coracana subsp. coracana TaxID=191504 RepID=A0AAV5EL91_ELECO|nr:hypothetical protein PR202_gb10758 [Eleusine coracana subsp. coracana]